MLRITTSGAATTVLEVTGEVDLSTADQLAEAIDAAASADEVELVTVDLAGVSFMDSAGLRVLVSGMKQADARGAKLVVAGPQPQVRKVFELTGLDEVLGLANPEAKGTTEGD
ncbi:hypothetical protein CFN78_26970 [Amycolatopsis antarctica]|uniref:Anti-sigma factor antagonist n=1 Tax=Amycolatopsis antarctica TaxID=1854586 RepID=A0A263CXG8_9PSEU|nr:STAS domain-containing protein [Amycolatopsis antarctica]OZM70117.1 hypothetical protein CFN78_26970 [Amycolatopsis antarctica]